jgi:(p)ppGpp synthase/HD superfamily hydrolase
MDARYFAIGAHGALNQVRKHSGIPYHNHPEDVRSLIEQNVQGHTYNMLKAASLHDVVEDTGITIWTIREHFGNSVARLVEGLTNDPHPEGMTRAVRKTLDCARLRMTSPMVKTIKLADIICNMQDIVKEDPKFAVVFMAEKRYMLDNALVGGDEGLWKMADGILNDYYKGVANDS